MVLKRTFKLFKRTDWRHGSGSTAAGVWHQLTEEVETGLLAAVVLAVRRW